MMEGLERDTDIVTHTQSTSSSSSVTSGSALVTEEVEDAITDVHFQKAIVTGGATTATDIAAAGGNSLIIVDGSQGPSTQPITMSALQTLQGGGSTIQVRGIQTGLTAGFTAPGSMPTLNASGSPGAPAVITAAEKTHIAGVNVQVEGGGLQTGVFVGGPGLTQVVVEQSNFEGLAPTVFNSAIGIAPGAQVADVQVFDVTASNLGAFAATLAPADPNVTNLTATNIGLTDVEFGFFLAGFNNLTIENVTQTGGQSTGFISLTQNVTITNYMASLDPTTPNTGLSLRNGIGQATITNMTIDGGVGSTATGVSLVANSAGVGTAGPIVFDGLHLSNYTSGIVETAPHANDVGDVTIRNSSFTDISGHGILLQNAAAGRTVLVEDNTFDNVANTAGTFVLRDFSGSNIGGDNNTMTNVGDPCQAGPLSGSINYTDDGAPNTCP